MIQHSEDLIYKDEARSLQGLFTLRVKRSPDNTAYTEYNRETQSWESVTWSQMQDQIARWQSVLQTFDLEPGDRVALSLKNGIDWITFEQASLGLGLVVIPLYTDDRADNIAYILEDGGVKCLLLQDINRWHRISEAIENNQYLKNVLLIDGDQTETAGDDIIVSPINCLLSPEIPELVTFDSDPSHLATIVYTSGTTGRPKGVMLSHSNILSIIHSSLTMISVTPSDLFLSFLPLSHMLERAAGYYLPMMAGAGIAFSRSIPLLADDLAANQPTIMIVVPRIFERIYSKISTQLDKGPFIKKWMFHSAVNIGWHRFGYQQGRKHWHPKLLWYPLLHKLVGAKIMDKLGGRLRLAISGGAALPPEIARVFIGLGVEILQGYGLTETSPVISVNVPEDNDPFSVGIPLRGIDVRIGRNNELECHSAGVMLGYWNNHKATAEMIDRNGWLKTGDQARIDSNGHIYITGRIKDILVLSNGEKIPPGDMEMAICNDPLFEQSLVVGEGESFLAAIIVLNADLWPGFAQDCGVDPLSTDSLLHKKVIGAVLSRLRELLHDFPGYAKIRRIHLTLEPWTVDNGMSTPTMKIKRNKVIEHYADKIEAFYNES